MKSTAEEVMEIEEDSEISPSASQVKLNSSADSHDSIPQNVSLHKDNVVDVNNLDSPPNGINKRSLSESAPRTPSSARRKLTESERLKRIKDKEIKEKQKIEEKERKEKEKNDLKLKREKEKNEKEEKKRQKEDEKKQKLEQRLEQIEEKKKREELKLEEKRKKEEEKQKETEKEKQLMQNFFIKTSKKQATIPANQLDSTINPYFMPFELKRDMRLAPCTRYDRTNLTERMKALEDFINFNDKAEKLYLDTLKEKCYKIGKSVKTWLRDEDDDLIIISNNVLDDVRKDLQEELKPPMRKMKFLQFHDSYRPAYYGTWMKKSSLVTGRRPLAKDSKHLDYEVDSDEEWEEEEPGESIVNSEGEEENDELEKGDEEVDDEFFVPHGYLSEGEGCDDNDDVSPERLKQIQMLKAKNFEASLKSKKLEKLRPVVHGLFWWDPYIIESLSLNDKPADCKDKQKDEYRDMFNFFKDFMALPINCKFPIEMNDDNLPSNKTSPSDAQTNEKSTSKKRIYPVPDEALPFLIKLVHGCYWSMGKIAREFKQFWHQHMKNETADKPQASQINDDDAVNNLIISKRQLEAKVKEIATYKKDPRYLNRLWYVNEDVLEKYNLQSLPIPSTWEWSNTPSSSRKHLSISTPSQLQECDPVINKEAKTPKMSVKVVTPQSTNNISSFLIRKQSHHVKKKISPSCNAVLSESTAKARGSDSSRYPSESAFSPVDGAAHGVTYFENKKQNNVDSDMDCEILTPQPPPSSKKRSSEMEMGSDVKRSNNPFQSSDNSSQDCIIIDSNSQGLPPSPLKILNPEHADSKPSDVLKDSHKGEIFKTNNGNVDRENKSISNESSFVKTNNKKTIKSFF